MFSEYASKFLAQSQSRISFASPPERTGRQTGRTAHAQAPTGRYFGQRTSIYQQQGTGFGQLGFTSRASQNAPLFHSIAEDATGAEEEEEHEREVADYFALQRSRKHFVHGQLEDSSGPEDGHSHELEGPGASLTSDWKHPSYGIKSSWHGDRTSGRHGGARMTKNLEMVDDDSSQQLADTMKSINLDFDESQQERVASVNEDDQLRLMKSTGSTSMFQPTGIPPMGKPRSSIMDSELASESLPASQPPPTDASYHDRFWAQIYLITLVAFLTSYVLVWLHVSPPTSKQPLGDTVYNTIRASYHVLAVDTVVAVIASMVWLAVLRSYARSLVTAILLGVPVVLFAFTLYPFISSFKTTGSSSTIQDSLMRWLSLAPMIIGGTWMYGVYKSRHVFKRAVDLLELAVRILGANPPLVIVGFATLAIIVAWTWLWIVVFTRVFLSGHLAKNLSFVVDVGTWWLGIFYVLVYLWTLNVIAGIQRATTAASVSQWYFHRSSVPVVPTDAVVRAALSHALTACLGTICLSTLLALLMRLPVLVLPRRITILIGMFSSLLIPDNLMVLTHPTTITYAAIHGQSLTEAARAVSQLTFTGMKYRAGAKPERTFGTSANRPHRLALLLLYATRLTTSFGFGFAAWVHAARAGASSDQPNTYKGSLYAYVVGLIAGAIGWAVIGSMESVLTGIVDAVVICWESEVSSGSPIRYCREAEWILGDDGERGQSGNESEHGLLK